MTQVDKELLLKDLCARLPYGVIVQDRNDTHKLSVGNTEFTDLFIGKCNIKPYLRSMSSMTEEEKKKYLEIKCETTFIDGLMVMSTVKAIDWLLKNHFDFRGLIPKGLAIEAPEGMYGKEEQQ